MVLKKMMRGRLGNQMFQYAFMRAVQQKYFPEAEIQLCFKWVEHCAKKNDWEETDSISDLEAKYTRVEKISTTFVQKILIIFLCIILGFYRYILQENYEAHWDRIEEKFKRVLTKNNILWRSNGFTEFDFSLLNPRKDILFFGHFECEKYFGEIREILLEDFKPVFKPKSANAEIYSAILNENSVCVSIRRGDFVSKPANFSKRYICTKEYFDLAIFDILTHIRNPKLIFFSDDIEWVRENFEMPFPVLYESGDDEVWEKLNMMRLCKHFIISNSTFSWWAQYLSENPQKVVVAPSRWLNIPGKNDIYQDNWRLIRV